VKAKAAAEAKAVALESIQVGVKRHAMETVAMADLKPKIKAQATRTRKPLPDIPADLTMAADSWLRQHSTQRIFERNLDLALNIDLDSEASLRSPVSDPVPGLASDSALGGSLLTGNL